MRFEEEGCNWKTVVKNEILNAFAPRSGWIWKNDQIANMSLPKDDTRTLSINEDNPIYNKLEGRLRMLKKLILDKDITLNLQCNNNKYNTTKTREANEKKIKKRLTIYNGSKVNFQINSR